ncbi:hypothetical protein ACFCZ1_04345 [Streptomyces sp. NPDC056224]|uniref:hypothetical protein n=1 Tax=Streptomyces sp. NPDC056224 TaxID=3345750 RepID=UPI0035D8AF8A
MAPERVVRCLAQGVIFGDISDVVGQVTREWVRWWRVGVSQVEVVVPVRTVQRF